MTTTPSIEAFLTQPGEDLDDTTDLGPLERALANRGAADGHVLPTSPLESIAESLRTLVGKVESHTEEEKASDRLREAYDDLEGKHQVLFTLVEEIEQAIGKSTAKPSLAAKALIDAWRKPEAPAGSAESDETDQDVVYTCPHCQTGWGEVVNLCTECGRMASGERVIVPAAPVHDAPVDEWRAFALKERPDLTGVDQMNRSQIRTMLGIEQPADGA